MAIKLHTDEMLLGPLIRYTPGYYHEENIENHTSEPVVIIDHANNKSLLAPVLKHASDIEYVDVKWRNTLDSTATPEGTAKRIPGFQIKIPKHVLMTEGCLYISALNRLICSEPGSINACHPKACVNSESTAYALEKSISKVIERTPTVVMMINDPQGRCDVLYSVMGDMLLEIPVTHHLGAAELKLLFVCDGKRREFDVDIDKFLESNDSVIEIADGPLAFLTKNKIIAERSSGEYRKMSRSEVLQLTKDQEARHKLEIESIKRQHEITEAENEAKIRMLKSEIEQADAELKRVKAEYAVFTGSMNAGVRINDNAFQREKLESSASQEKWKTIGVYGTLTLAAITLLLKAIQLGSKTGII